MPRKITMLGSRLATLDTRAAAPLPKDRDTFYHSEQWRRLLAGIIKVRGRRCEDCGKEGSRVYGDHVVERRDGGADLDPSNVRLLCARCHGRKTEAARAARARR